MKKILAMVMIFLLCISTVSCAMLDKELRNYKDKKDIVEEHNWASESGATLIYNGVEYRNSQFLLVDDESDVFISWSGLGIPLDEVRRYYSYTEDNPVYIVQTGAKLDYFIRTDFDEREELFVIEDTDCELELDELIDFDNICDKTYRYESTRIDITVRAKMNQRIYANLSICKIDNVWFAVGYTYECVIPEVTLQKLKDYNIIYG